MNVKDLITNLAAYAAKSPENGNAEVMLQYFDDVCYGLAGANDAHGMPGQRLLIIVPDIQTKIHVKALKVQ